AICCQVAPLSTVRYPERVSSIVNAIAQPTFAFAKRISTDAFTDATRTQRNELPPSSGDEQAAGILGRSPTGALTERDKPVGRIDEDRRAQEATASLLPPPARVRVEGVHRHPSETAVARYA